MQKYVYHLLIILLGTMLATMCWNYVFDTSGLFNRDFSVKRVEPNQHFVKMRHILTKPKQYDAFCFGSSRVGNIDLSKIGNGLRYYNMSYSEGVPAEYLIDLQVFIKKGVNIKQIIIGLDDFSFRVNPEMHKRQFLRIPYTDNIKIYFTYLLKRPGWPADVASKGSVYDVYGSGRPMHPEVDEKIEANIDKHISSEMFKNSAAYKGNRIRETIYDLKAIKDLCETKKINLVVFINPVHAVTYLGNNLLEFNEFKYQLVQITDYYDFSGINDVTTNNYYYYETSHYRPLVGDMIVGRLFNKENDDFGVYVTKDNIDEHLKKLEAQLTQRTKL